METTTLALLDRWKKHHGLTSDYAAAKRLQITAQAVSNWRKGRSHADVEPAAKMAEEIGLEVIEVLAAIQADREPREPAAAIWRRYGRPAFIALVAGFLVPVSMPSEAPGNVQKAHYATAKNATNDPIMRSRAGVWLVRQAERLINALSRWFPKDDRARRGNLPLHPCFKSM